MGDNTLFFDFEDEYDLQQVVKHEPWTYKKHLVIFERVRKNVPVIPEKKKKKKELKGRVFK